MPKANGTVKNDKELLELEDLVHKGFANHLDQELERGELEILPSKSELLHQAQTWISELDFILSKNEEMRLIHGVVDRILGLGPLEPLLEDPAITEIMVLDPGHVYIERDGKLERVNAVFKDEEQLRQVIDRIVSPIGRRVDESSPLVDARLPDGSRVNAIIPPLAIHGPALTIRKFSQDPFTLGRLVQFGTMTEEMAMYLTHMVRSKKNIIISGGTGSGKTTTLNALGLCIPETERIITIEDAAELQLRCPHLIALESRPPNIEEKGEVTIRTLVRNALRMRPDRIIIGEVRGGEAFDMLQAMNTGHKGSLTTLHANSTRDALTRLETMVLTANLHLPVSAIQRMISSAIEVIVQQERLSNGRRVIESISQLKSSPDGRIRLVPVFAFDQTKKQHLRIHKSDRSS